MKPKTTIKASAKNIRKEMPKFDYDGNIIQENNDGCVNIILFTGIILFILAVIASILK